MQIESIWIENEHTLNAHGQPHDPADTNSDVIVTMTDRSRWVATFFSYDNIRSLTEKNRATGERLGGRYFWTSDLVLVDTVTRERIEQVIADLLADRSFEWVFKRSRTDDDDQEST